MAKIKEEELERLKKIQEADDDDLSLDLLKSRKMHKVRAQQSSDDSDTKVIESGGDIPKTESQNKSDTKKLLVLVGTVVVIILIFVALLVLAPEKQLLTIDELHQANLAGNLDSEDGYVYNGFSFIKFEHVWYSQIVKGNTIYDVTFNNGPRNVENITVEGQLGSVFSREYGGNLYITFDSNATSRKYIAVANAGLSLGLAKGFQYNLTAGCTNNESALCQQRGVFVCGDSEKAVIYFKEAKETKVIMNDTCVIIQGTGIDLVRAKDRLLLKWYGMMD